MVNINLTNFIVGFILVLTVAVLLISVVRELGVEYGTTEQEIYGIGNGSSSCPINGTIGSILSINALFQNSTLDAVTHAPGQENAQEGTDLTSATQASGLVTTLKLASLVMVMPKTLTTDLGCAIGLPAILITSLQVIFAVVILVLIAGLFYFRKV